MYIRHNNIIVFERLDIHRIDSKYAIIIIIVTMETTVVTTNKMSVIMRMKNDLSNISAY